MHACAESWLSFIDCVKDIDTCGHTPLVYYARVAQPMQRTMTQARVMVWGREGDTLSPSLRRTVGGTLFLSLLVMVMHRTHEMLQAVG